MALINTFTGFETGGTEEWATGVLGSIVSDTTTVNGLGGYSCKNVFNQNNQIYTRTLQGPTAYTRWAFNTSANPNGLASVNNLYDQSVSNGAVIWIIRLVTNASNQLFLRLFNNVGATQVGSDFQITANIWYWIETKLVMSATVGILEMKVYPVSGGTPTIVASGSGLNTGTLNVAAFQIAGNIVSGTAPSGNYWTDDVAIGDNSYIGPGYCIARQGQTGTPTNDAWTKNGLSTSALCWSETPFNATDNCSSNVSGAAQTMLVADFSVAGSATEGVGILRAQDNLNACKAAMICKCSAGSALKIRRRVGGVNTDFTPQGNPATTDSYSDTVGALIAPVFTAGTYFSPNTAPFTDNSANLDNYEIGAVKQANTNTDTVEDMWMMIDYTPGPPGSITVFYNIGDDSY